MSAELKQDAQAQPETPKKENVDQNLSNLRRLMEQERQARLKAEEEISRLKSQKQSIPSQDDEDDYGDEPYIDQKAFKKKMSRFEEKIESTIEKKAEEKARYLLEQEKQADYIKRNPDFQNILSSENIQQFAEKHPSIAERMLRMPDNFDRQALLYEQIKALNSREKKAAEPSIQDKINQNQKGVFYRPSGTNPDPYNASAGDFSPAGQKTAYTKLQELKSRLRLG